MSSKRVSFSVKTTGTINSVYIWVERKNVTLRNSKGYIMLAPRKEKYDVVFLGKGTQGSKVEVTAKLSGTQLCKASKTANARGVAQGHCEIGVTA